LAVVYNTANHNLQTGCKRRPAWLPNLCAMQTLHLLLQGPVAAGAAQGASLRGLKNQLCMALGQPIDAEPRLPAQAEVWVHMHSPGGECAEGFAIADWLTALGCPITTVNEGRCHSIAGVVFAIGHTRLMAAHAELLLHNAWGQA